VFLRKILMLCEFEAVLCCLVSYLATAVGKLHFALKQATEADFGVKAVATVKDRQKERSRRFGGFLRARARMRLRKSKLILLVGASRRFAPSRRFCSRVINSSVLCLRMRYAWGALCLLAYFICARCVCWLILLAGAVLAGGLRCLKGFAVAL